MILAVDTGTASLGWALCKAGFVEDCGALLQPKVPGEAMQDAFQRKLTLQVDTLLPLMSGVSALYAEALSFPRNSVAVASVSICWGALICLARLSSVPLYAVPPKSWQHRLQGSKRKVDQRQLAERIERFVTRYCPRASVSLGRLDSSALPHAIDACGIGLSVSTKRNK